MTKMKIIGQISLIIFFINTFCSCTEKPDPKTNKNPIQKEIEKFVISIDSTESSRVFRNVFTVNFKKENDSLFVEIKTSYYYPDKTEYYYFIKDYMIAFQNTSIYPYNNWIKKLKKTPISKKFESETEVHMRPFEPQIKKYAIISSDSIRLISHLIY